MSMFTCCKFLIKTNLADIADLPVQYIHLKKNWLEIDNDSGNIKEGNFFVVMIAV